MKNKKIIISLTILIIITLSCSTFGLIEKFKTEQGPIDKPEIPEEVKKTLTLKIIPSGSTITNTELTCENDGKGCTITLPEIEREGYTIEEYTDKEKSPKAKYKVLESITIKKDTTLYALTSKEVKLRIDYPHNEYVSKSVYREDLTCKIYNEEESCKIKLPSDDRDGWKLLGFVPLYMIKNIMVKPLK